MGWLAEKNQKQEFLLYQQTTFTSTYNVCMRNCTKISWRHIFEVIWGHLGTFEGSQLIRLIVVIIEDGGKSGDELIILERRMTPRPRLSRLVAHLRNNPNEVKNPLSPPVTLNPFTRSDLDGREWPQKWRLLSCTLSRTQTCSRTGILRSPRIPQRCHFRWRAHVTPASLTIWTDFGGTSHYWITEVCCNTFTVCFFA